MRESYFFSPGFDSLGELGLIGDALGVLELDEAVPPAAPVLLAPVPDVELLDASAPVAGDGVGVVVVLLLLVLGEDAGAGVVTVFSSFLLQAERPTTTRAAIRSERFIFYPLEVHHTRVLAKRTAPQRRSCLTVVCRP